MGRPTRYPPEFRREAVELVQASGRPVAEVARSLDISGATLYAWMKVAREQEEDPNALSESERTELRRLRKENVDLKTDREILRKAAAYFARETTR